MSWVDDTKSEAAKYHIKNCPKCGGKAVPCGDRTCGFETYWVRCTDCNNKSGWHVEIRYAIREWNEDTEMSLKPARQNGKLRAEVD